MCITFVSIRNRQTPGILTGDLRAKWMKYIYELFSKLSGSNSQENITLL